MGVIFSNDENPIRDDLENSITAIAKFGAIGTSKDFLGWIKMYNKMLELAEKQIPGYVENIDISKISNSITLLAKKNLLKDNGLGYDEYISTENLVGILKNKDISYYFLGDINFSPLQLVRSRLESFLRFFQIAEECVVDISIGVIEAAENAIKYGCGGIISVNYHLGSDDIFEIEMINPIKAIPVEKTIETGKFNEGFTLMRGVMAMNKLFDTFDIIRDDDEQKVTFKASKKVEYDKVLK